MDDLGKGTGSFKARISSLVSSHRGESDETLQFKDVCVDLTNKRIIWSVSGNASPGRVLAIMGPSGSGKTTLLNTLAGYAPLTSGTITLNGIKISKKIKRQISYVLQSDIFFPNLTLRETLRYAALLRLPREFSVKEKLSKVEEVINTLRLTDCADTMIGDVAIRGLSGGEKKRANICCELLTNPTMLLLDEPTSGLDSSSAYTLMDTLCKLAKDKRKIIVTSIHQPSSQLYHMFDDLLLLAKGKVAYFGKASKAVTYLDSQGLRCMPHYNPADFMLEMVTQDDSRKVLIGEDPNWEDRPISRTWWKIKWFFCRQRNNETRRCDIEVYDGSPKFPPRGLPDSSNMEIDETSIKITECEDIDSPYFSDQIISRKWPTPWYWQLLVLIVRTFRQSRHIILSKLNLLETILLTVIVSLIWFQIPDDVESIDDRLGYVSMKVIPQMFMFSVMQYFFAVIFWSFHPLVVAAMSLPAEHTVVSKERQSGSYHLSAYYLAKLLSELPLVLLLPTLFFSVTYWCGGFNNWFSFLGSWFVILINAIVAQGLGLLIGAVFMDIRHSLVAAPVIMLTFMMLGGFYVQRLPDWLQWAQYVSFVTYSFDTILEFGFHDLTLRCGSNFTNTYESCMDDRDMYLANANVSGSEVLEEVAIIAFPWYWNILINIALSVLFRTGAYIALRFLHKKHL